MSNPSTSQGLYLYAIIAGAGERHYGISGIEGSAVVTLAQGQVVAVVSEAPDRKIRPERRHLSVHHQVLRQLLQEKAVLPMTFGSIAESPQALLKMLSRYQKTLLEQLDRVFGKVEMSLCARWDVPNIFEHFITTHLELKTARDQAFGAGSQPTQAEKIEIGQLFERLLQQDRETCYTVVERALSRNCAEIKRNPCRNEQEALNLACLIHRDRQAEFETGVFEVAREFNNNFSFDYNGPWLPHHFVTVAFEL